MAHWQPILTGELKERALQAARAICEALKEKPPEDASLAEGFAGRAILYRYLARVMADESYEALSEESLNQSIELLAGSSDMSPSLYTGFTGVAFAAQLLTDTSSEDPCEAIDEALLEYLEQPTWEGDYELIMGLVGYGVYALERLPKASARACLEKIVTHLESLAVQRAGGLSWHTSPRLMDPVSAKQHPKGYVNLGLAHGMPGVIALLGRILGAGVEEERARRLLQKACAWLLGQRSLEGFLRFPSFVSEGSLGGPRRAAWCYGDAGVAASLLVSARATKDPGGEQEALEIFLRLASCPKSPEIFGVKDACLCHGAAGLAHLFNRAFQATKEPRLKQAAISWLEETLSFQTRGGVGGFFAFRREEDGQDRWIEDGSLLTGATGIALSLLAAAGSVAPEWDRVLLVSPV